MTLHETGTIESNINRETDGIGVGKTWNWSRSAICYINEYKPNDLVQIIADKSISRLKSLAVWNTN